MKTAWLLEAPGPKYVGVTGDGNFNWTTDANKARRYDSEEDARIAHELFADPHDTPSVGLFDELGGAKNVAVREHAWPETTCGCCGQQVDHLDTLYGVCGECAVEHSLEAWPCNHGERR